MKLIFCEQVVLKLVFSKKSRWRPSSRQLNTYRWSLSALSKVSIAADNNNRLYIANSNHFNSPTVYKPYAVINAVTKPRIILNLRQRRLCRSSCSCRSCSCFQARHCRTTFLLARCFAWLASFLLLGLDITSTSITIIKDHRFVVTTKLSYYIIIECYPPI